MSCLHMVPSYLAHLVRVGSLSSVLFFAAYPYYNNFYYSVIDKYFYGNDALYFTVVFTIIHMILYWSINSFFLFCDYTHFLSQYKLPRLKYQIPDSQLIKTTMIRALSGQLFFEPLATYFVLYPLMVRNGTLCVYDISNNGSNDDDVSKLHLKILHWDLITFINYSGQFIVCTLLNSWLFYFFHRILHHPALYGRIHKQHHEYKGTIGFAAECM